MPLERGVIYHPKGRHQRHQTIYTLSTHLSHRCFSLFCSTRCSPKQEWTLGNTRVASLTLSKVITKISPHQVRKHTQGKILPEVGDRPTAGTNALFIKSLKWHLDALNIFFYSLLAIPKEQKVQSPY